MLIIASPFCNKCGGWSFTALNLFTAKQLKTQTDDCIPLNGHDANLDCQDGLEEAPLYDAISVEVTVEYLKAGNNSMGCYMGGS